MNSEHDDPASSDVDLNLLEQQKRELEHAVQQKQGELEKHNLAIQEKRIELDKLELEFQKGRFSKWFANNSSFVVLLAAALALVANTVSSCLSMTSAREVEHLDLQQSLMLRAMESDDDKMRSKNLQWFLDLGWLTDENDKIALAIENNTVPQIPPSWSAPTILSNIVFNGGFEVEGGWIIPESEFPARYVSSPSPILSGKYSMELGPTGPITSTETYSAIYQKIVLPSNSTLIQLRCWLYAIGNPPSGGLSRREILVTDEEFNPVAVLYRTSDVNPSWSSFTFDMTPLQGRTVNLVFAVRNADTREGWLAWYIDDVEVLVAR